MSHTLGEWYVFTNEYGQATSVRCDSKRICVMRINDKDECNSDAKLIAAAPDMLEFITQIAKIAEMGNLNGNKLYSQAKDLIEKATV